MASKNRPFLGLVKRKWAAILAKWGNFTQLLSKTYQFCIKIGKFTAFIVRKTSIFSGNQETYHKYYQKDINFVWNWHLRHLKRAGVYEQSQFFSAELHHQCQGDGQ